MGKWTVLLLLVGVAIAGWFVYSAVTETTPVLAVQAEVGAIREFVDERAKTRLPQTYLITMPYDGRIEPITLQEGDPVKKDGPPVARLVPSDIELIVQAAERSVERLDALLTESRDKTVEATGKDQASLFVDSMVQTVNAAMARLEAGEEKDKFARSHYARIERLYGEKAATDEELERAQVAMVESNVDYRQDQFVLNAIRAMHAATVLMPRMVGQYMDRKDLSTAVLEKQKLEALVNLEKVRRDRSRAELFSPVDGVVLERAISNERHIGAGTELLQIGRLEDLEVVAEVLSQDVVNVKEGDPVQLYGPAIGPKPATGSVTRIFPAGFTKVSSLGVEQQRVKVIVQLDAGDLQRLLDEQGLGVDYRVRVKIVTAHKENALLVPRSAIFRGDNGQWKVYSVVDGCAQLTTIKIGLINDRLVEVEDGLNKGAWVVLAPESGLEPGQRVEVNENEVKENSGK